MTSVQCHQDFQKSHGSTDPQRHLGTSMAVLAGLGWRRWRHFGCLRWWNFMARVMEFGPQEWSGSTPETNLQSAS